MTAHNTGRPSTAGVKQLADPALADSYETCRALHREHGTTYYWATRTLPRHKQPFVHALYGLCRYADEIVDAFDDTSIEDRSERLFSLDAQLVNDLARGHSDHPVLAAVVDTSQVWGLPSSVFSRFFKAMRADLTVASYETYSDLVEYMDGSAAVIGEMMFPILEPTSNDAFKGARDLGVAFQLTNFLRDVGEDLDRGRVYFPTDELARFDVDIHARTVNSQWREFCTFQIKRMNELYRSADHGISLLPKSSARSIRAARVLYARILDHVVANDYDVFSQRARVPLPQKLWVVGREIGRR